MPRRRWRLKARHEPLSQAARMYLELGPGGVQAAHKRTPLDGYAEAVFFEGKRTRAADWQEHGAALIAAWVPKHPGTRPWGWWAFDAMEHRRCVVGTELLMPTHAATDWQFVWRAAHGVPAFQQRRPPGYVGFPAVESQARYLDRLGLLGVGERADLAADAFDHEAVNPFIVDGEEIERPGVADDCQHPTRPRFSSAPGRRSSNSNGTGRTSP